MANKLIAVALVALLITYTIIPALAVPDPVGYQPTFFDYSYFPIMPDDYYIKPYKLILYEKRTGYYHLFMSDNKFYHLNVHNMLINYDNSLYYKHYTFKPDLYASGWQKMSDKREFRLAPFSETDLEFNYLFYYTNHNINNRSSPNTILFYRNDIDFINVTLALCDLRYRIKMNLQTLVPIGILLFSSFVGLYMIRKWFYPMSHFSKKIRRKKHYKFMNHKRKVWKK